MSQVYWRRWSFENVYLLPAKSKWTKHVPNLKIGDMVTVKNNKSSPIACCT